MGYWEDLLWVKVLCNPFWMGDKPRLKYLKHNKFGGVDYLLNGTPHSYYGYTVLEKKRKV